nr:MAG TPA: hypothetical protein [Caudoviricetes sp.]
MVLISPKETLFFITNLLQNRLKNNIKILTSLRFCSQ